MYSKVYFKSLLANEMIRKQTWLDIHSEVSNRDVFEMLSSECESNVNNGNQKARDLQGTSPIIP